jgi:hypothetical protein
MRRQRKDQYILTVAGPQSDVNTLSSDDPLVQEVISTSIDSIQQGTVDNTQQTPEDGALQPIQGLWHDQINVPVEVFQEGLREVADDGDPATLTAMGHLLASVFQHQPNMFTRSKVLASPAPTTTACAEARDDGHAPTSGYASTQMGMVLCRRAASSANFWRMFSYTPASDLLTFPIALPGALALDDILYAGLSLQYREQWDSLPYGLTIDITGNDEEQNARLIGAVGALSIPSVGVAESPKFAFTFKAALGVRDLVASRPAADYQTPLVLAGSAITIAPFGGTAGVDLCADVEINIGSNWSPMTCRNLASGLQNWKRGKGSVEVKVTFPHHILPSTLKPAAVATSWRAAVHHASDSLWQLQAAYGQQQPGSAACFGFPCLRLVSVSGGEKEEDDARVLTFRPAAEYAKVYPAALGGLA